MKYTLPTLPIFIKRPDIDEGEFNSFSLHPLLMMKKKSMTNNMLICFYCIVSPH